MECSTIGHRPSRPLTAAIPNRPRRLPREADHLLFMVNDRKVVDRIAHLSSQQLCLGQSSSSTIIQLDCTGLPRIDAFTIAPGDQSVIEEDQWRTS